MDHARDTFLFINQFRDQMPRPIFGIGHSVGAVQLYVTINRILHYPQNYTQLKQSKSANHFAYK